MVYSFWCLFFNFFCDVCVLSKRITIHKSWNHFIVWHTNGLKLDLLRSNHEFQLYSVFISVLYIFVLSWKESWGDSTNYFVKYYKRNNEMKKLNYSFLSSKFFDWAMKNDPNGTVTSMKSWISIFCSHQFKTTYSKIPEKERRKKRGEKIKLKKKEIENSMYFVLRLITKAFSRKISCQVQSTSAQTANSFKF